MKDSLKRQKGMTLVEVFLVTIVIGVIIIVGLRQVLSLRLSAEALQVRSNVDVIMSAMGNYYKANCLGSADRGWGTLYPAHSPAPANPFPIDIKTDLIDPGYLTHTIPLNSIVDDSVGMQGYVTQFNKVETTRYICVKAIDEDVPVTGLDAAGNCETTAPTGTIISWKPQVAVKLAPTAAETATVYLNLLGGDCLSTGTSFSVDTCVPGSTTGDFIVWQRNPSLPQMYENSPTWGNSANLLQFSQAQRTYGGLYLTETGGVTPDGSQQYFVCGD